MTENSAGRFVVGTGRCGSTLLSRMLAEHADVVSLHEFFTGLDWGRRFDPDPVGAEDLVEFLSADQPVTTEVLARGYTADEICYPFGADTARLAAGDGMPWLLVTAISRLTDDPHPLYDSMLELAAARPATPMADHYRAVFEFLTAKAGGRVWIERSGSSIDYLGELHQAFPDARFVHIHRDGPETALSIRAHPFYRVAVAIVMDLFPDLPEDEAITSVIENAPPVEAAARYWSDQLLHGFAAMGDLAPDQVIDVAFEDLLTRPADTMDRIAAFFTLPDDPEFGSKAAALVSTPPRRRYPLLGPGDQEALTEACHPGQVLLGRA
jgi:hypothetical protein